MNLHQTSVGKKAGYSLIELGLVIAVLAILAGFAVASFGNTDETRDASMVQSAHASLQSIVSQGSVRMDVRPVDLNKDSVVTAMSASLGSNNGILFERKGEQFLLTIKNTGRSASFQILPNGDVSLVGLVKFPHYEVDNSNAFGTIHRR